MNTEYTQNLKVLSSQTSYGAKLGILQSLGLLQDNMCEYFKAINCDGISMIPTHNCFFVVTKTRLRLLNSASWLDNLELTTNVNKLTGIRVNLYTEIKKNNNLQVVAIQELCAMDNDSRKIRMLNTTKYPQDVEVVSSSVDIDFDKIDHDFVEDQYLVSEINVKSSNVDFYLHTNNVEYVRFILDTIPVKELIDKNYNDIQINYLFESREGDVLNIYRKKVDNGYLFLIEKDNIIITQAKIQHIS